MSGLVCLEHDSSRDCAGSRDLNLCKDRRPGEPLSIFVSADRRTVDTDLLAEF